MNLANGVSLIRLPLSLLGVFFFAGGEPLLSLLFLLLSGVSDILDGWAARKFGSHRMGSFIDRACDLFSEFTFTLSFYVFGNLPWWLTFMIFLRVFIESFSLSHWRGVFQFKSAMTWLVFFFFLFKDILLREAPPLGRGMSEIALPFIFYPLATFLEFLNLKSLLKGNPVIRRYIDSVFDEE